MNKVFLGVCAAALMSMPLCAEGVLPWDGKWVQGPCSSASGLKIEDNKVVGVVEIARKNRKYSRYSADQKITPIKGDFQLSATLNYATKDKQFLGYAYVQEAPYDVVVIGSLTLGQLLRFREEAVLTALAQGIPVYLYTPGLPESPKNRALSGSLTAAQRELKNWGVLFTDGGRKKLITAEEARALRSTGRTPAPGCVLTPLAKEILEGTK